MTESARRRWRPGLTTQILIALVLGVLLGWLWPAAGARLGILATIFIRLVMVIIAPLVFSTLVVGIAGPGELRKLGSLALQAVILFLVLTAVALLLAFTLANLVQPGQGLAPPAATTASPLPAAGESFWVRLFPRSIVDAMARGDVLQIVVFSLLFAVALAAVGERGRPMLELCRSLADVMYRFTDLVMRAAPLGVLGAAAALVSQHGLRVGQNFLWLTVAVYAGLALMLFVLYPLLCLWFRIPLAGFFRAIKEPFAIAFATTSSAAALPKAMEVMERFGVPRRVVAFVLPTGTALNLAGSALFIGVAALFIAQAFQISLSLGDQLRFFVVLAVASKSVANVPRASLVALAAGLSGFGVPPEVVAAGFGFLLGIDPILDMPRTGVNTAGNCLAAALVARWQGGFRSGREWRAGQAPPRP
ncbi:MAG: dicarboxylate/amino acid:cation symporter [Terriglobia bacterium]